MSFTHHCVLSSAEHTQKNIFAYTIEVSWDLVLTMALFIISTSVILFLKYYYILNISIFYLINFNTGFTSILKIILVNISQKKESHACFELQEAE